MTEKIIREYVPSQPQPQPKPANAPTPIYELKSSLTGKKLPPIFIGSADIKVQVPIPPKSNCKKCFGKGHLGIDHKAKTIFICQKCYPNHTLNKT